MMLECDYLVVGGGASAMAFVDELFHSTKETTFIVVDKHHKPGGHWNDAYKFVKLHQPACFYGVKSKPLGRGVNDLASCTEICCYYEELMQMFESSGRVCFYPQCEYQGNNVFRSLLECGLEYSVKVNMKTVDATYTGPSVPSMRKPEYEVGEGMHLVPVNGLATMKEPWERYVVVGGGKTGVDAVLYLLRNQVKPGRIFWIIPNDYWLFNRKFMFAEYLVETVKYIIGYVVESTTYDQLIESWEKCGLLMRIDRSVEPRAFKAGLVTEEELIKLRLITNVIRQGRVASIESDRIIFQNGSELQTNVRTLHVDCTSNGTNPFSPKPIFNGSTITLQTVRMYQACYSGSCIGAFEACFPFDEEKKNCSLIPLTHPQNLKDYVRLLKQNTLNNMAAAKELGIRWVRGNRLDIGFHLPLYQYAWFIYYGFSMQTKMLEALDEIVRDLNERK